MICEGECDDTNPAVSPGAIEVCDNGIDDDCDQLVDCEDLDCLGWISEDCDDGIDDDCDGLTDFEVPDCDFTLLLVAYYWSFKLNLDFTLGPTVPVTWANSLILTSPTVQVIPLWTVQLPSIDPPTHLPTISFPFPSVGWVGIYTGLFAEGGVQAVFLEWVFTG